MNRKHFQENITQAQFKLNQITSQRAKLFRLKAQKKQQNYLFYLRITSKT